MMKQEAVEEKVVVTSIKGYPRLVVNIPPAPYQSLHHPARLFSLQIESTRLHGIVTQTTTMYKKLHG
jgi:hypothetical protein